MKIKVHLSGTEATAFEKFAADFDFASPEAAAEAALRACLRTHGYLHATATFAETDGNTSGFPNTILALRPGSALAGDGR